MGFFSWLCDRSDVANLIEEGKHLDRTLSNRNLSADERLHYVRKLNRVLDELALYKRKHPFEMSNVHIDRFRASNKRRAEQASVELGKSAPSGWEDCVQGRAIGVVLPGSGANTGVRLIVNGYMFGIEGEIVEIVAELVDAPFYERQNIPNGRTFVVVYLVKDREPFSMAGFAAKEVTKVSFDDYKNL